MKKFKITASYVTYCEVEIKAENHAQAESIARDMDGGQFETRIDNDDWHIEKIVEVQP